VPPRSSVPWTNRSTVAAPSVPPPVTSIRPSFSNIIPENVFAPERVSVPDPCFSKSPVPEMTPENAVDVLSPPAFSVLVPNAMSPDPAMEPTVRLLATCKVPGVKTFTWP
jgi:hypothetical protein